MKPTPVTELSDDDIDSAIVNMPHVRMVAAVFGENVSQLCQNKDMTAVTEYIHCSAIFSSSRFSDFLLP